MIHVERPPAPAALKSRPVARAAQEFASDPSASFRYSNLLRVKADIHGMFHGKCAYCESRLIAVSGDIENFRPKGGALNLDGSRSPDHYRWLAYEWTNLYLSCQVCNVSKALRFPVAAARAPIGTRGSKLAAEKPLLLDPCHDTDSLEKHLVFLMDGRVVSDTERGRVTIDVLSLNRLALVRMRQEDLQQLSDLMEVLAIPRGSEDVYWKLIATLQSMLESNQPYLAAKRQVVRARMREIVSQRPEISESLERELAKVVPSPGDVVATALAVEQTLHRWEKLERQDEQFSLRAAWPKNGRLDRTLLKRYFRKRRLVRRVELRGYRGVADLTIDVPEPSSASSWMMLLGENGTGKTSILHAIAVTLMGDAERRRLGVEPDDLLSEGADSGHVHVHLTNVAEPERLEIVRGAKECGGTAKEPKVLLLGYGATRLLPRTTQSEPPPGPVRTSNLLQQTFFLRDAAKWLADLHPDSFERTKKPLADLLLLDSPRQIVKDDEGRVRVRFGKRTPLLGQLSDGFQSMMALAVDLLSVLEPIWQDAIGDAECVVLIDEIDSHLHPRWRMQVVERLRRSFPRVQFITSTHDPLCLRGLRGGEVALLQRTRTGRVVVQEDVPSPEGMSADQLLTSEHFGLSSTIDPKVEALFRRYYRLLRVTSRTPVQEKQLADVKAALDRMHHMGTTVRERLMLEAIDRHRARPPAGSPDARARLRGKLDSELSDISTSPSLLRRRSRRRQAKGGR